ncbi:hypothetical protein NQ015_04710 [Corynebacterium sp. 153RC1]|uniref:hypothetical protein n=1 Tax=Corynebacterium TaxID=1716 RepID=UPI00211BBE96|nr:MULTISPECIES: hypothetical protein [unclassified Corynebacterium]MCQ9369984.1 hypothetical protein [Corynebacterium sp. 35RC1]MCQ9343160.1 hypothetical protein [Corynebacterium sp. 76QC2CO]MCQ9352173.1 hypothetical protein [Corynebacterium sp. 209RC1]MCQ9354176.1 hypothetical protein [Corynebacterium sp. 1222RC1]MCQ9356456.1 hypothetical protein [Corynebacterium sp. 122RC1]
MRVKGIILLVLGAVLFGLSFLLLGAHDVNALLGALLMGIGGASVVASLQFLFGEKPRTQ